MDLQVLVKVSSSWVAWLQLFHCLSMLLVVRILVGHWTWAPSGLFSVSSPWTTACCSKAKRERDIYVQMALYSNPMSKRAVKHNMRMQDHLTDLVDCLTFVGQVLVATPNNLPQGNMASSSVKSNLIEGNIVKCSETQFREHGSLMSDRNQLI